MTEKREEIIARKIRTFTLHSTLLLTILCGLGLTAVMGIFSWNVVLVGGILVAISMIGDAFSLGASVLFRYVMLPNTMKRKNDHAAYFDDDDELVAGNRF